MFNYEFASPHDLGSSCDPKLATRTPGARRIGTFERDGRSMYRKGGTLWLTNMEVETIAPWKLEGL